jgi:hypothetical protein
MRLNRYLLLASMHVPTIPRQRSHTDKRTHESKNYLRQQQGEGGRGREIIHPSDRSSDIPPPSFLSLCLISPIHFSLIPYAFTFLSLSLSLSLLGYHPPPTYLPLLFDPRPARARKLAWRLDGTSRERAVSLTASANRDDAPHPLLCFRFRNFHIREGTRAARLNVACPGEKPLALARARQEIGV